MKTRQEVIDSIYKYAENGASILVYGSGQGESITRKPSPASVRSVIKNSLIPLLKRVVTFHESQIDYVSGMMKHFPDYSVEGVPGQEVVKVHMEHLNENFAQLRIAQELVK